MIFLSALNFIRIKKDVDLLNEFILVILGSVVLAMSSQLSIALKPVPITFQTFVVLFIGMTYGWRLGGCAIVLYLFEGAIGLPVFANFSYGLPVLFGPTGGYLLGFIPATIAAGWLVEKVWAKNILGIFLAGIVGTLIIFVCGWLMLTSFVGIKNAYLFGVKPFLFIDIMKIISVTLLVPKSCRKNRT